MGWSKALYIQQECTVKKVLVKKDLIWFLPIAVAVLILSSLPFWAAKSAQTPELLFHRKSDVKLCHFFDSSVKQALF